ncbi:hypothetical protein CCHR01_10092 [Colletotrichum chrysophilum]|uniref:Uncharacterized protein n=1 Tax=Colletotrichum chrysophilum TaxID=1836956 RepID=A0AAD9AGM3_9PEZI|nr:hypothetical protein CCHR01_10092 [Colletotrichum chrysophilum]
MCTLFYRFQSKPPCSLQPSLPPNPLPRAYARKTHTRTNRASLASDTPVPVLSLSHTLSHPALLPKTKIVISELNPPEPVKPNRCATPSLGTRHQSASRWLFQCRDRILQIWNKYIRAPYASLLKESGIQVIG